MGIRSWFRGNKRPIVQTKVASSTPTGKPLTPPTHSVIGPDAVHQPLRAESLPSSAGQQIGKQLFEAAMNNDMAAVVSLLKAGADPNFRIAPGTVTLPGQSSPISSPMVPLMIASMRGHGDVVGLLLSAGADIDAWDDEGWTPLIFALSRKHYEIVSLLVDSGADIDARNDDGWTAIMFAVKGGLDPIVRLLIEKGANVNIPFGPLTPLKVICGLKNHVTSQGKPRCEQIESALREAGAQEQPPQAYVEPFSIDTTKFRITRNVTDEAVTKNVLAQGQGKADFIEALAPLDLRSLEYVTGKGNDYIYIRGVINCNCGDAFPLQIRFKGQQGQQIRCLLCNSGYHVTTFVQKGTNSFYFGISPNTPPLVSFTISEITFIDESERRRRQALRLEDARRRAEARKSKAGTAPLSPHRGAKTADASSQARQQTAKIVTTSGPVIDLRSAGEKAIEQKAQQALLGDDEQLSRRVAVLIEQGAKQYTAKDSEGLAKTSAEIKSIGEHLYAHGGHSHMQEVYYRVQALGARARLIDLYWDGIGEWQG